MDYRKRLSDSRVQTGLAQVNRYHTEPARVNTAANPVDRRIIADLDFTLRYSPNHLDALRLLLAYTKAGGQSYEFYSTECYLDWARRFAPDDVSVLQLEAMYYAKSGQADKAEQLFRTALAADPKSRELHYLVGLFYAGRKQYAEAREHARIAYEGGYPLPGLRNMLERAGQWTPAAVNTPAAKP
jgi:tetratricopeptide (TPR) repeat protein